MQTYQQARRSTTLIGRMLQLTTLPGNDARYLNHARRGNVALHGKVGQERRDLRSAEVQGMALVVKHDEATRPVGVGILGADRVVPHPDRLAQSIQQARRRGAGRRGFRGRPFALNALARLLDDGLWSARHSALLLRIWR